MRARSASAALVVALALTGCGADGGESACAAAVEVDGAVYLGSGDAVPVSATDDRTVAAVVPGCNDTNGPVEDDTAVTVRGLPGAPTSERVWFAGLVYERG